MQSSSILCSSSNFIYPSLYFSKNHPFTLFPAKQINSGSKVSFTGILQPTYLRRRPPYPLTINSTATQELVETTSSAPGFVETGYIFGVHGFQGEVRVKPNTDFPDLRFSKPGTRWLKQQMSGADTVQEIELVEGRGHPGQSWIVRFNNIETAEQAQKLVGSAILVKDEDRPELDEGEFYTHDLIAMRVILKESREPVGTVVNVFNSGASDLLHVKLDSLRNITDQIGKSKVEAGESGPLVWVPFVEAIVPTVDLERREMLITPPKGLLELNIRSDERSKKERRELQWKERKKFQRRLISAKKKLIEMEQQHVFDGFRYGEKEQRSLLANEIVTVNSKLLQQALQNIKTPYTRQNLLNILSTMPKSNTIRVSDNSSSAENTKLSDPYLKLQREGCLLTRDGKVAIILLLEETEKIGEISNTNLVKALLDDPLRFAKIEDRSTVPLVLVSSSDSIVSLQDLFSDHDYFAFDPEKVWFLEEEKLPVVSSSVEGDAKHKILMRSPWEFLQSPIGSGGLISLFSSQDSLLDELSETGVEYIEVCKINEKWENNHALVGHVGTCKANVGIRLFKDTTVSQEEDIDVVFSMSFFRKLVKQINMLQFEAVDSCNSYVEKVDKDWVDVNPSDPNSYAFRSSIFSCLSVSPISKVCVLDSTE